ncbi:MAG: VCBS repeat-containing protein, partial [Acidimicrobiia bacterium]|nr:VCBS repeat-containing protein [Acidimicrobiia bacterium]
MTARRRRGGGRCALAVGALVLASCGSSATPPEGADVDRSPEPAMELVTFTDVAAEVGVDFRHGAFQWDTTGDIPAMMGGGVCWLDYDGDGWMDLFAVNTWSDGEWGRWRQAGGLPTSRLYRNERGRFVDVTEATGAGLAMRGNGCVAADFDGDGYTDLYVTSDRANALLWNVDGERFDEGAEAAGAATSGWHSGAAVGDLDGDGQLDLYVAGYADPSRPIPGATKGFPNTFEPVADLVLVNQGTSDGSRPTFADVAAEVGVERTQLDYGLGAVMTDVDADGDLDVYVANDTQPNRLYVNRADAASSAGFGFDEVGVEAGVGDDNAGMGVAAGDYDGDGMPDLVVSNHEDQVTNVFRSDATAGFVDALPEIGQPDLALDLTGWGASWFDADLDA